jgi:hypothetical protein
MPTHLLAMLVVVLTSVACVDTQGGRPRPLAPAAPIALAPLAFPVAAPPPDAPSPRPPSTATPATERGVRLASPLGVLYVPHALAGDLGDFDLLVHFHGDTSATEVEIDRADLRAVLLTVNLGTSSNAYATHFQAPSALADMLRSVEMSLHSRFGATAPHARRVALSGWSAGYAAVLALLAEPSAASRVDAVLLEDGPHAMFKDPQRRVVDEHRLAPLVDFARRAFTGDVLVGWTHSAIRTLSYASTTESSAFVLDALPLERVPADAAEGHLHQTSSADRGAFHLRGYAGDTAKDHCDHLLSLSRTLLPMLRERWGA